IITVNGRPDFATTFQFSATPRISRLSNDVSSLFASMDDELHFMMSSAIPDAEAQRLLLAEFGENFGVSARAITDQLVASASSTSSMGTTLNDVLSAYNQFVAYFNANANSFLQSTRINLGPHISREFFSGLVRLVTSFPAVRIAVQTLQGHLESATTATDVPSDVLRSLARAVQFLKSHLPLLAYTFQRLGVNLYTAETFMVLFNQDLQTLRADFMQETVAFNAELSAVVTAVSLNFTSVGEMFDNAGTQLNTQLTGREENQTDFMSMLAMLKSFTSDRSMFLQELKEYLQLVSMGNQQSVETQVTATYYVDNSYSVDSPALVLAMQLISSNVYDRLCYNKYAALVADLPTLGRIRLSECFHTELPRLRKLQELIQTYTLMVSYDVEDLLLNLYPCRSEYAADDCFATVGAYYPQLNAARDSNVETRAGNFFISALTASVTRIALCFTRTNYYTFQNLVPSLERNIRNCRGV
uniref:Uncharacterized protein n=1 Tax=Anopheles minimus TaxID=112268 RepID=A0A182WJN1_9DIPT